MEAGVVSKSLRQRAQKNNRRKTRRNKSRQQVRLPMQSNKTSGRRNSVDHHSEAKAETDRCSGCNKKRRTGSGVSNQTGVSRIINVPVAAAQRVGAAEKAVQEVLVAEFPVAVVVAVVRDDAHVSEDFCGVICRISRYCFCVHTCRWEEKAIMNKWDKVTS
jgi:hypothetical protein